LGIEKCLKKNSQKNMEVLTAPHYLPTYLVPEIIVYILTLATVLHASTTRRTPLLTLTLVSALSFHFFYRAAFSHIWSAKPSILSVPFRSAHPHEMLLSMLALYASSIVTDNICHHYRNTLQRPIVKGIISGFTSTLFLSSHEILAPNLLWRTWDVTHSSTLHKLWGVPVVSVVRTLLFCTFVHMVASASPKRNPHEVAGVALLFTSASHWTLQVVSTDMFEPSISTLVGSIVLLLVFGSLSGAGYIDGVIVESSADTTAAAAALPLRPGPRASTRSAVLNANAAYAGVLMFYFAGMMFLSLFGDPSTHTSFGYHQKWGGACDIGDVVAHDVHVCRKSAESRAKEWRLCTETFEGYAIGDIDYQKQTVGWYGICGMPRDHVETSMMMAGMSAGIGSLWFGATLCLLRAAANPIVKTGGLKTKKI
jgi:hypothetical protein